MEGHPRAAYAMQAVKELGIDIPRSETDADAGVWCNRTTYLRHDHSHIDTSRCSTPRRRKKVPVA